MRHCVYLGHSSLEYTFIFYIHCLESSPKMGGHFWELITPSGGFWKKYWHNLSKKENIWTETARVQQLQGPEQIWLLGSPEPGKALPAPCAGHRHRTRADKKQRQQKRLGLVGFRPLSDKQGIWGLAPVQGRAESQQPPFPLTINSAAKDRVKASLFLVQHILMEWKLSLDIIMSLVCKKNHKISNRSECQSVYLQFHHLLTELYLVNTNYKKALNWIHPT